MTEIQYRQCSRCQGMFDAEAFFHRKYGVYAYTPQSAICIGCENTERDRTKITNRWRKKVSSCRRREARKFGLTVLELESRHRWDLDRMAYEAEHTFNNTCPYCWRSFAAMGHGPADVTLDIVDPEAPPHYGINTRWCCATCNKEKQRTPPDLWGRKLASWRQWEAWQAKLRGDAWTGTLFEGLAWDDPWLISPADAPPDLREAG